MGDRSQWILASVHRLLSDAARDGARVRVYIANTEGHGRPARVVEGVVVAVADGRDGRPRVRLRIPTGTEDPVEVRVLLDGIEHAELAAAPEADSSRRLSERRLIERKTLSYDTRESETPPTRAGASLLPPAATRKRGA
jgi:hypothetical protein